jgi:hypothetical protein
MRGVTGELSHIANPIASQYLVIAIRRARRAQYIAPVPSVEACWHGLLIGDSERQRVLAGAWLPDAHQAAESETLAFESQQSLTVISPRLTIRPYEHRDDLLDAALFAWTAALCGRVRK